MTKFQLDKMGEPPLHFGRKRTNGKYCGRRTMNGWRNSFVIDGDTVEMEAQTGAKVLVFKFHKAVLGDVLRYTVSPNNPSEFNPHLYINTRNKKKKALTEYLAELYAARGWVPEDVDGRHRVDGNHFNYMPSNFEGGREPGASSVEPSDESASGSGSSGDDDDSQSGSDGDDESSDGDAGGSVDGTGAVTGVCVSRTHKGVTKTWRGRRDDYDSEAHMMRAARLAYEDLGIELGVPFDDVRAPDEIDVDIERGGSPGKSRKRKRPADDDGDCQVPLVRGVQWVVRKGVKRAVRVLVSKDRVRFSKWIPLDDFDTDADAVRAANMLANAVRRLKRRRVQ